MLVFTKLSNHCSCCATVLSNHPMSNGVYLYVLYFCQSPQTSRNTLNCPHICFFPLCPHGVIIKIHMQKQPVTFCFNELGKRSVKEPGEIRKKIDAHTPLRSEMSIYNERIFRTAAVDRFCSTAALTISLYVIEHTPISCHAYTQVCVKWIRH